MPVGRGFVTALEVVTLIRAQFNHPTRRVAAERRDAHAEKAAVEGASLDRECKNGTI